jgi:hypothetical protein
LKELNVSLHTKKKKLKSKKINGSTFNNIELNTFQNRTLESIKSLNKTTKKENLSSKDNQAESDRNIQLRVNRFDSHNVVSKDKIRKNYSTSVENIKNKIKMTSTVNSTLFNNNSRSVKSSSLTYCPRIHNAQIMKKVSLILFFYISGKI